MRDLNRIDAIIEELREFWKTVPDWRLTQLIDNAVAMSQNPPERLERSQMFNVEDEHVMRGIHVLKDMTKT